LHETRLQACFLGNILPDKKELDRVMSTDDFEKDCMEGCDVTTLAGNAYLRLKITMLGRGYLKELRGTAPGTDSSIPLNSTVYVQAGSNTQVQVGNQNTQTAKVNTQEPVEEIAVSSDLEAHSSLYKNVKIGIVTSIIGGGLLIFLEWMVFRFL